MTRYLKDEGGSTSRRSKTRKKKPPVLTRVSKKGYMGKSIDAQNKRLRKTQKVR